MGLWYVFPGQAPWLQCHSGENYIPQLLDISDTADSPMQVTLMHWPLTNGDIVLIFREKKNRGYHPFGNILRINACPIPSGHARHLTLYQILSMESCCRYCRCFSETLRSCTMFAADPDIPTVWVRDPGSTRPQREEPKTSTTYPSLEKTLAKS